MTSPNRFLITVGAARYDRLDPDEQLPSVVEDIRRVTELFCADLGYERVLRELADSPHASIARQVLSDWLSSAERSDADHIVIYWSGHGETGSDGRHYLLARGFEGRNYVGCALASEDLGRMVAGSPVRHLLMMLDTCYAGEGIADLAALQNVIEASRAESGDATGALYLVAASRRREVAQEGAFSRMLAEAVHAQRHGGWTQPFLDPLSVVGAINERMQREVSGQRVVANVIGFDGGLSSLIPNPRYEPRLPSDLEVEKGRRLLKRPDLLAHWGPRARGVGLEIEQGDFFQGRTAALRALVMWLSEAHGGDMRVVTGKPGSGKSAVLARLTVLSDAEYRETLVGEEAKDGTVPAVGAIDVAVHARGKTVGDVTAEIAHALGCEPLLALVIEAATASPHRPVVLVDALDEALEPRAMARELLRPLAESHGVKLIIGTRSHLIAALGADAEGVIDLDDQTAWFDARDVERYADRILAAPTRAARQSPYASDGARRAYVARQVARRAQATFLIARLVARSLAERVEAVDIDDPDWIAHLPSTVGEAFEEWLDRFGADKGRVRDLLRPLAFAEGRGLPWEEVWPALASVISGRHYGDADVEWALEVAGAFVVESRQSERSVYRLFHEALAEHLRPPDRTTRIQRQIAVTLRETVPTVDNVRAWELALGYIRSHLATHAGAGGVLDEVLEDPAFLVAADPARLLRALSGASGPAFAGVRRVYHSAYHLLYDAAPDDRASYLEMYAQRHGVDDLAERLATRFGARPWSVQWTNWWPDTEHFIAGRHDGWVFSVAAAVVDDRAVAVSSGGDGMIRVWDLQAAAPMGPPIVGATDDRDMTPYSKRIDLIGLTQVDGAPVIVTSGPYQPVHLSDLESGHRLEDTGIAGIWAQRGLLATPTRLCIVQADPAGRATSVYTLDRDTGRLTRVAEHHKLPRTPPVVAEMGNELVLLYNEGNLIVCAQLISGRRIGKAISAGSKVGAVAAGILRGEAVVVSAHEDGTVQLWNPASRKRVSRPLPAGVGALNVITVGHVGAALIAVVAGEDRTLRVLDLDNGEPVGGPLVGHTGRVTALALGEVNRRAVVVSGSDDRTVRVWDLLAGLETTHPPANHPGAVRRLAATGDGRQALVIAVGRDRTVHRWELDTGATLGEPVQGEDEPLSVALGRSGDEMLAALGYSDHVDLWSLTGGLGRSRRLGARAPVKALTLLTLGDATVLVAGCDRAMCVWTADGRERHHHPRAHEGGVTAAAAGLLSGRPLALTAGNEGTLQLWDLESGDPVGPAIEAHSQWVTSVALADIDGVPVGISASSDMTLRVWRLATMTALTAPLTGHSDWINAVAVGEVQGQTVLLSGSDDHTVRVWSPFGTELLSIAMGSRVRTLAAVGELVVVGADAGATALRLQG